MRKFVKLAAAVATTGLAVFGSVAASGGVANAAPGPGQSVTGCSTGSSALIGLNVFPTCNATDSTVLNPTSFTVAVDPSFFTTLNTPLIKVAIALARQSLAMNVSYTLACSVNGTIVSKDESFQATTDESTQSQTVDLQAAVGSPIPNSCQVQNLTATSLASLSAPILAILRDTTFTFGVTATATAGVPGAIWMSTGRTSAGAGAGICVDDANNGNAGSMVQVYQCNSDLAQYWTQSSDGHIVHNGVCLTQNSKNATLAKCSPTNHAQMWTVNGTGGHFNTIVNHSTSQCLTASSPKNFTQITVSNCNGGQSQHWTGPAMSLLPPAI